MMFSPLARGTGSCAGEFDPSISNRKYTITLPEIDLEPLKLPVSPPKTRPHTVVAFSNTDLQIQLPKTYITRKGALLLFTAPETEAQSELNSFRQKLYSKLLKEASSKNFGQKLGTLERLSMSILQFGDEGFVKENSSITDPESKFFLHFLQTEDDGDLDTRSQPGGDLPSYLRDLKYRARSHLGSGDTYMPKSRAAQELRSILRGLDNNWPLTHIHDGNGRSLIADQFTRPVSCTSARSGSPVLALNPFRDIELMKLGKSIRNYHSVASTINISNVLHSSSATSSSIRQVLSSDKLVASLKSSYCPTPPNDEDSQGSRTPHSGRLLHRRQSAQTRLGTSIKEEGEKPKGKVKNAYWPVTGMMDDIIGVVAVMGRCEQLQNVQVDGLQKENISIVTSNMEVAECTDSLDYHTEECREEGPNFEEATDLPDKNDISVVLEHSFIEDESYLELAGQIQVEVHNIDKTVDKVDVGCEIDDLEGDERYITASNSNNVQFDEETFNDSELEKKLAVDKAIEKVENTEMNDGILQNDQTHSNENSEISYRSNISQNVEIKSFVIQDSRLEVDTALGCIANEEVVGDNRPDSLNEVSRLVQDRTPLSSEENNENDVTQTESVAAKEEESNVVQDIQKPQSVIRKHEQEETGSVILPLVPQYTGTDAPVQQLQSSHIVAPPPSTQSSTPSLPGSRPESLVSEADVVSTMKPRSIIEASGEDVLQQDPITLVSEHLNVDSPVAEISEHLNEDSLGTKVSEHLNENSLGTKVSEHLNEDSLGTEDAETELQSVEGAEGPVTSTMDQTSITTMMEEKMDKTGTKVFSKTTSDAMSDMLGITSAHADSLHETDKSRLIVRENNEASKSSKQVVKSTKSARSSKVRFPEYFSDAMKRNPSISKKYMDKGLKQMSEIASSTLSGAAVDKDDKGRLTEDQFLEAQEMLKERMSEAKKKMDAFERSPTKKRKEDFRSKKKTKKEVVVKKDLSMEKELRKLEKQRKTEEVKALHQKITEKAAKRKAQEDEVLQKSKELEEEMARIQLEADEMEKVEEAARQQLAESRQKQREDREARRKETLEKKKQDALEKREKEKKLMEKSRKKEREMLGRIADAEMWKRLKEDEDREKDEEERLAQEKMEEELLAAKKIAEEEEERMRELEREAEEEVMQRLIDERNEAKQRRRELEVERLQMEEVEEKKRQIMLAEEMKLQEEQRLGEEEEKKKMDEERRWIKELERLEAEAQEHSRQEVERCKQLAMKRREKNLEAKANLDKMRRGQGITRPRIFSYFVKWPRESYERSMGNNSEKKNTKKGVKKKARTKSAVSGAGKLLDATTT